MASLIINQVGRTTKLCNNVFIEELHGVLGYIIS